jgi:signal transduction histidine kinase
MGDLVDLVERMRDNGLDVRVRSRGTPPMLPAGIEVTVYRVVQEALTNALKHAGIAARVDVDLEYAADQLTLAVRSKSAFSLCRAKVDGAVRAGRGLIGMRERIGMHGGQLQTRAEDDGVFVVLARIPL